MPGAVPTWATFSMKPTARSMFHGPGTVGGIYAVKLSISVDDRQGMLAEITSRISDIKTNIKILKLRPSKTDTDSFTSPSKSATSTPGEGRPFDQEDQRGLRDCLQ